MEYRAAIKSSNPALYDYCINFPSTQPEGYREAYEYGLMDRDDLFSTIHSLEFHSSRPYMFHEVVELTYWEGRKTPLRHRRVPLVELTTYLHLTGFQDEGYTLAELIRILFNPWEAWPPSYTLGYASTHPTIVDFIESISLEPLPKNLRELEASLAEIRKIKERLVENTDLVIKALQRRPIYSLVKGALSKEFYWIYALCSLVFKDEELGKFLFKLSDHHRGFIPRKAFSGFVNNEKILIELSYLPDERIAMEKLLLIAYNPESARLIYNSAHPIFAFRDILMKGMTGWRRDIAMKINWGGDQLKSFSLSGCYSGDIESYYNGHKQNLVFDSFILRFCRLAHKNGLPLEEIFIDKEFYNFSFRDYEKGVIEKEYQGTVYSIIQRRYVKPKWGHIDPLSEKVNPDIENECVNILTSHTHFVRSIWPWLKYTTIISKIPITVSRLIFSSEYFMHKDTYDDVAYGCREDDNTPSVEAIHKVYDSLAKYCQPQVGYLEMCNSPEKYERGHLYNQIWKHNIEHCDLTKSFGTIVAALNNDGTNLLTKKMLLKILRSIVEMHISTEMASELDFTAWTISLRNQLYAVFNELHEGDSHENDDNSITPESQHN